MAEAISKYDLPDHAYLILYPMLLKNEVAVERYEHPDFKGAFGEVVRAVSFKDNIEIVHIKIRDNENCNRDKTHPFWIQCRVMDILACKKEFQHTVGTDPLDNTGFEHSTPALFKLYKRMREMAKTGTAFKEQLMIGLLKNRQKS